MKERRCSIYPKDLLRLVSKKSVVVHYEDNSRCHKLFWSQPDDAFFIAVYDGRQRVVVTVMPIEYNKGFPIGEEKKRTAKELALSRPIVSREQVERIRSENLMRLLSK